MRAAYASSVVLLFSCCVAASSRTMDSVDRTDWTVDENDSSLDSDPLWTEGGGLAYAGFEPNALNASWYEELYGITAQERGKEFIAIDQQLYCGNASDPYAYPGQDIFPAPLPPTVNTYWYQACPMNISGSQDLFDAGLASRMVFNDNEATCAFMAASGVDPECAMAYLGAALSMGPNVNYAFIASASLYRLILEQMELAGLVLHESDAPQNPFAPGLYQALLQRYCVAPPYGNLSYALGLDPEIAFQEYDKTAAQCEESYQNVTVELANLYPEDPNLAVLAAGALMEAPAWKWWHVGSVIAGADTEVQTSTAADAAADTPMGLLSEIMKVRAANANLLLQRGMNSEPYHLGLLHYMVHNMEAASRPDLGLVFANRMYAEGGSTQGHAAHMMTHTAMRVGNFSQVIQGNIKAMQDDAYWNLARTGGGIVSALYHYNNHNIAFNVEAGQHASSWSMAATALADLNVAAGFDWSLDPIKRGSQVSQVMRQLYVPLRFGKYYEIIEGTNAGGPGPVADDSATNATVTVHLPGNITEYFGCASTQCSTWRLYVRTVAFARIGDADADSLYSLRDAYGELYKLVDIFCTYNIQRDLLKADGNTTLVQLANRSCDQLDAEGDHNSTYPPAVRVAVELAEIYALKQELVRVDDSDTGGLDNPTATGTLTINNDAGTQGLKLLVPAAEVQVALGNLSSGVELMRIAVANQNNLFYDEPSPFFYPVGETLAGFLMKRGEGGDYDEAAEVLRTVLFQWPYSALPVAGLVKLANLSEDPEAQMMNLHQLTRRAFSLNDTEVDTAWL